MKHLIALLMILLLLPAAGTAQEVSEEVKIVGEEILFEEVTDFYYTVDASTFPPYYQRYRLYTEDGTHFFYHETREGGGWPQTEENITRSGTKELGEDQWDALCGLLRGGEARVREEYLTDGDAGPWMYIYWKGGEEEGREFFFASREKEVLFEEVCEEMSMEQALRVRVSDGTHTVLYLLNDSPPARSLYDMLPMDVPVENYGRNEKIFYPDQKVDPSGGIEGDGKAGTLALFSPWGNVVMFYESFDPYPGLYLLGQALDGTGEIEQLSGTVHIEAAEGSAAGTSQ